MNDPRNLATDFVDLDSCWHLACCVASEAAWWAAIEYDRVGDMEKQLSYGGDPNHQDDDLNTGLHLSVYCGSMAAAEFLLAKLVDVDAQDTEGDTRTFLIHDRVERLPKLVSPPCPSFPTYGF